MTSQWRKFSVYSLTLHKPLICIFEKIRAMGFDITTGLVFAQFFHRGHHCCWSIHDTGVNLFFIKKNPSIKTCVALNVNTFCTILPCQRWFVFIYTLIKIRIYLYIPLVYIHLYYIFIHKYDKYEYCLHVNMDIRSTRIN